MENSKSCYDNSPHDLIRSVTESINKENKKFGRNDSVGEMCSITSMAAIGEGPATIITRQDTGPSLAGNDI